MQQDINTIAKSQETSKDFLVLILYYSFIMITLSGTEIPIG
jgi:hypothetical protein